jgi:disease resistance protein RPM1
MQKYNQEPRLKVGHREMAEIMVSASTGAMNSLLGKLATLMGEEFFKLKNLRKEIKFINDELIGMKDALEGLSYLDELDLQTKRWRDIVREMSYDIEDIIDDFMQNIAGSNKPSGFVSNTIERLRTLRARHKIAGQIEDIKNLVIETSARHQRYKLDTPLSSNVVTDPRVVTLYENVANLVGVEAPTNELVNFLAADDKQLKMVSIVGFGGLGKTTLANVVYGRLKGTFNKCAFVPVSQKPNIPKLLHSLLSQLGSSTYSHNSELNVLLDQLREHLQNNRYMLYFVSFFAFL